MLWRLCEKPDKYVTLWLAACSNSSRTVGEPYLFDQVGLLTCVTKLFRPWLKGSTGLPGLAFYTIVCRHSSIMRFSNLGHSRVGFNWCGTRYVGGHRSTGRCARYTSGGNRLFDLGALAAFAVHLLLGGTPLIPTSSLIGQRLGTRSPVRG